MFGLFFGTACLLGLSVMAIRGRYGRYGHHGHGGCHGRRGFGRRGLGYVLERLDTTPGQDKVILGAIDDLREHAREVRTAFRSGRKDVAEAFRAEDLDEQSFRSVIESQMDRLSPLREEFAKAMATIHETLTPKQRERLASFIESAGPFGYRHAL